MDELIKFIALIARGLFSEEFLNVPGYFVRRFLFKLKKDKKNLWEERPQNILVTFVLIIFIVIIIKIVF